MSDLIENEGLPFLAHVLKRVSDEFVRGCAVWYPEYGLKFSPRAGSTVRTLARLGPLSIKDIAATIGQSHPSTIDWVRQLKGLGLVETQVDSRDRRRTLVSLTAAGKQQAELHQKADAILAAAYRTLLEESGADLLAPLWHIEKLGKATPFEERLRAAEGLLE